MPQIKYLLGGILLFVMVLVAGCAKDAGQMDTAEGSTVDGVGVTDESSTTGSGIDDSGAVDQTAVDSESTEEMIDPLDIRTIYFDFDEAIVDSESQSIIQAHADVLMSHPSVSIQIAGHADERGTREYNLALGDQRAQAVSSFFQEFGISASRITVVSYGEELPAAVGSDESAWSLNRRSDFDYTIPQ